MCNMNFNYVFCFKNSNLLTFLSDILVRRSLMMFPALENNLSQGTLVATMQHFCLTISLKLGNACLLLFHQRSGSSFRGTTSALKYFCTSRIAEAMKLHVGCTDVIFECKCKHFTTHVHCNCNCYDEQDKIKTNYETILYLNWTAAVSQHSYTYSTAQQNNEIEIALSQTVRS